MATIKYELTVQDGEIGIIDLFIDGVLKATGDIDEIETSWRGNQLIIHSMISTVEHVKCQTNIFKFID
jgi:hypothetical protein